MLARSWFDALKSDAAVQLPESGVSPGVRTQWEQTQKAWLAANPQPDDSQKNAHFFHDASLWGAYPSQMWCPASSPDSLDPDNVALGDRPVIDGPGVYPNLRDMPSAPRTVWFRFFLNLH